MELLDVPDMVSSSTFVAAVLDILLSLAGDEREL